MPDGMLPHDTSDAAPAVQTLLAFDFGVKRIGVAIGNTLVRAARPLTTIDAGSNAERFSAISALISEWCADAVIVGRALHPDGADSEMTARCERFGRQLEGRFGLPVKFVDERYTSAMAESALGTSKHDQKAVDAMAAAIILQAFFDEPGNHGSA